MRSPIAALLLALAPHAQGSDWPTWRGPTGNGVAAADARPPLEWSEERNVRWRVELPGLGASTPIVVGGTLYLTCAVPVGVEPADGEVPPPPRVPHELLVLAFDGETGARRWATVVATAAPHEKLHRTSTLASASCATDGERLFAFFGSHGVYALDFEGEVLWSKDLGDMRTLAEFGEGATPVVAGGALVLPWDHEGQSAVVALEASTGEVRWRRERDADSSWGSPAVAGERVIVSGSDKTRAYAVADGELLWERDGMSKNPVNSPTVAGDTLFVMNSYKGRIVQALRPATAELVWSYRSTASYVPNPVAVDGLLFFVRDSTGVLECLDARTGEERFTGARLDGIRSVHASPMAAAGRLYVASRGGVVAVVRAAGEFELLARNDLDDCFDASPVAVGDALYLRGRRHLYCLAEAK